MRSDLPTPIPRVWSRYAPYSKLWRQRYSASTETSSSSLAVTSSLPILYCAFTSTVVLIEMDKA